MPPPDIRDIIDDLLSRPKQLAGTPSWGRGPRSGQIKWKAPLSLQGEVLEMDLIVIAYPEMPPLTFAMLVVYDDIAISRMDYGENEEHNNGSYVPPNITSWKIRGPHCHKWQDNKCFATHSTLPDILGYASLLPSSVRGFENTFRWFCGEHKIGIIDVPRYPVSELLL